MGIAAAFNFLVIKWKVEHGRFMDAVYDVGALIGLMTIFGGSFGGSVVATIASALVSIYLLRNPPQSVKFRLPKTIDFWLWIINKK